MCNIPLGGTSPLDLLFENCVFSQKIKQLWTKYPPDVIRNVSMNSKIKFYVSKEKGCEVTVNGSADLLIYCLEDFVFNKRMRAYLLLCLHWKSQLLQIGETNLM